MRLDSLAVHSGRDDLTGLGVHALPLDLSSTNPLPDLDTGGESYEAMATGGHPTEGGHVYQRLWNPTVARFETALATLEHAESAVAFASGMAAMSAAVLSRTMLTGKRHVVAVRPMYGGTDHLLSTGLLGTEVSWCTEAEIAATVRPDTALVVVETPANPTLELLDVAAAVAAAGDVPVLVDNTFATPLLQRPLDLGAADRRHRGVAAAGGGEHGDGHHDGDGSADTSGVAGEAHGFRRLRVHRRIPQVLDRRLDRGRAREPGRAAGPDDPRPLLPAA